MSYIGVDACLLLGGAVFVTGPQAAAVAALEAAVRTAKDEAEARAAAAAAAQVTAVLQGTKACREARNDCGIHGFPPPQRTRCRDRPCKVLHISPGFHSAALARGFL